MNLIVDIGNSGIKLAIFSGENKTASFRIETHDNEVLAEFIQNRNIEKAIISSVKDIPPSLLEILHTNIPYIHLVSDKTLIPFPVDYETPETLGTDRIAATAGAFKAFTGKDCLIIDAGSAITYDFLVNGRYKGGNISPGIEMRFKALNQFTSRLPLVKPRGKFSSPGVNTHDAIEAGVIIGVVYEINEYIHTFKKDYKNSIFVITGGDGNFLMERINEKVIYIPDLVLEGLNYILEYNAK